MPESLVTIAQFHETDDAVVAKTAMDSAGIESEVEDVRLEVHNEDAYRAFHVLDTSCPALPVIDEAYEEPPAKRVCAVCGSSDIQSTTRSMTFGGIAVLAIGMGVAVGLTDAAFFAVGAAGLFLLMTDRWRCAECGATSN